MFNPEQNRLAPTLAMIMAASLVGFITGYTVPLISLELAQQQIDTVYVGLLAALPPAGMMISSFLSPALCRRFEMGLLLSVSLVALAAATIASCLSFDMVHLLLPRLVTGLASGVIIVIGESWITGGAAGKPGNPDRHLCLRLYRLSAGGAAADLRRRSVSIMDSAARRAGDPRLPADAPPFALRQPRTAGGTRQLAQPRRLFAGTGFRRILLRLFDASILALLPLYGMDKGLSEVTAVLLVTVVLTGDAVFQAPLGWIADRFGIRRVHLTCAVVFCLALLALPFLLASHIQLIVGCLLLGAAAGALYTLSLVRAGKTFSGQKLIMINALLGFFWSAGSVAGPVVSGLLISVAGYDGLLMTLFVSGALFLLIQCLGKSEKALLADEREREEEMDDISEAAR
jgi:MFS family permease